ncbi:MAG TPA: hypothetical protein VLI90_10645, partial [Tepidisphaeraceae bacterium]|nr:hypothetical protein [Tepidisphaeraceae bacterium]
MNDEIRMTKRRDPRAFVIRHSDFIRGFGLRHSDFRTRITLTPALSRSTGRGGKSEARLPGSRGV